MAFLDILRGRKREEARPRRLPKGALKQFRRPVKKQKEIKIASQEKKEKAEEAKPSFAKASEGKAKQSALAAAFLLGPHITERTALLAKMNVYTFKVSHRANKVLVKKAIKEMFGFSPVKVRIVKALPKKRIVRGKTGIKPGFKKALVYLKEGDKIEFI